MQFCFDITLFVSIYPLKFHVIVVIFLCNFGSLLSVIEIIDLIAVISQKDAKFIEISDAFVTHIQQAFSYKYLLTHSISLHL